MAERLRPGQLRATVLHVLEGANRPLTGLEINAAIARTGVHVASSVVFRAIQRLRASGEVHAIASAHGYATGDGNGIISLLCADCGELTETSCEEVVGQLHAIGAARRFSVSRIVLEARGICRRCAARSQGSGRPPKSDRGRK